MKAKFITLIIAACCLAAVSSCSNAEIEEKGKADSNGLIELSVKGVLGEFKTEGTKSNLVNNLRVGWANNDEVLVFHKESQEYLGVLKASIAGTDDRTATLSGTIATPSGDSKTLVFVHGTGLNASDYTVGASTTSVTLDLSGQGEKTPFMVFGTAPYVAEAISNIIVDFSFATSVVSTYAAGLPAGKAVTEATLSDINTKCMLTIPASGDLAVSGSTSGTITKSDGIGSTNAEGQVLFEIAVPESAEAASDRSVNFTIDSKTYTTAFSGVAITSGTAYSAMSVSEVEKVILDKTTLQTYVTITQTLTATAYPDNSSKVLTWTSSNDAVATVDQTGKVTGMAEGTATITVALKDEASIKATCTVTVESDYVEMKMGTGVTAYTRKWRRLNLGATTVAGSGETCFGDYYAWGEIEPYYLTRTWDGTNKKWNFKTWYTSKSSGYSWQSYCGQSSYKEWTQLPYDSGTLTDAYDVAKQKLGNGWRMPTSQEFQDLYEACGGSGSYCTPSTLSSADPDQGIYWLSESQDYISDYTGVAGLLFVDGSKNRLFFPAAGCGNGTSLNYAGSLGSYLSSSLHSSYPYYAYSLTFFSDIVDPQGFNDRCYGFSVRPVSD